jgi:hypothetical protein
MSFIVGMVLTLGIGGPSSPVGVSMMVCGLVFPWLEAKLLDEEALERERQARLAAARLGDLKLAQEEKKTYHLLSAQKRRQARATYHLPKLPDLPPVEPSARRRDLALR